MNKKRIIIIMCMLLLSLSISVCHQTDEKGGIGVSSYSDSIEDNYPLPKFVTTTESDLAGNDTEEITGNEKDGEDTKDVDSNVIKIGFLYQKSGGPFISIAEQTKRGFDIGLEYMTNSNMVLFDGKNPIEVVYIDTQNSISIAKKELETFYQDPNSVIAIGSTDNNITKELTGIAEEYQKILLIEPAYADELTGEYYNKFVFKSSPNIYMRASAVAKTIDYSEEVKAVVVTEANETGDFAYSVIEEILLENGGEVFQHFSLDTQNKRLTIDTTSQSDKFNFNEYFDEIDYVVKSENITHLIIFWDLLSKPTSVAIQYTPLFILVDSQWVIDSHTKVVTEIPPIMMLRHLGNAEGVIGSTYYYYNIADYPMTSELVESLERKYNLSSPDSYECSGFTAASIVLEILKRSNGDFSTENLISLLEDKEFETPKGYIKIRKEDHQALQAMFIVQLSKSDDIDINWSVPDYYGLEELFYEDTAPPINN